MLVDYLGQLAEFVTNTRLEEMDNSTVEAAQNVLLDTIGAILAGSRLPENANLARLSLELGGTGPATLLGYSGKAQPIFAALVNATAGDLWKWTKATVWAADIPPSMLPLALLR